MYNTMERRCGQYFGDKFSVRCCMGFRCNVSALDLDDRYQLSESDV